MPRLFLILMMIGSLCGQDRRVLRTTASPAVSDEYDKFTSVGQMGLTVTNFGILGNGWNRMEDGSIQPSCQYKQHTETFREQVEHFSYAGGGFPPPSLMVYLRLETRGLSFLLNHPLSYSHPLLPQPRIPWPSTIHPMLYPIRI